MALNFGPYGKLEDVMIVLRKFLRNEFDKLIFCENLEDHLNQEGFLRCHECISNGYMDYARLFVVVCKAKKMSQNMENLPIDIHYNKLLDWLVNRRHCSQQWQGEALSIREKINAAVQDMPEVEEIKQLLEGTYINYFHCQKITELLKDTDSGKKNMFGQYSSQKMKDWAEILKLYENNGVYLGETAQMLARNVNYEIPALKKQVAKCQQLQKDCDRKEMDYVSKAAELRKQYDTTCRQMGIQGKKIKSELSALVSDLPDVFNKLAESCEELKKGISFYDDFVNFLMNGADLPDSLPVLRFVISHGNCTTYEWRTGKKPEVVEEPKISIDVTDEQDPTENLDSIDWGDTGGGDVDKVMDLGESSIDFGESGIDFGISDITLETGGVQAEDAIQDDFVIVEKVDEIHWGEAEDGAKIPDEVRREEEGVARGDDALSLLDNPQMRNLFIDDLLELEAFLNQRLVEMKGKADVLSSNQFHSAPESIQLDVCNVEAMLSSVKDILVQLTSVQIQHLMLIRNSPRYVDRLKESLKQTLTLADKMVFLEKEMVVKRRDALEEQRLTEPKLDVITQRTKEMQKQMEQEISKKYKDRPVNIMGEINTI
ncbi:hypothetical protein ScPMuIL_012164 [Solemya velum]